MAEKNETGRKNPGGSGRKPQALPLSFPPVETGFAGAAIAGGTGSVRSGLFRLGGIGYDVGLAGMKTTLAVTGRGDQQWHHKTITVEDTVLRQGVNKGAHLALVNTDDKDDIFSLIEVHRGRLEEHLHLPPTAYKVSDKDPRPPNAEEGREPARERKGKRKAKVAADRK